MAEPSLKSEDNAVGREAFPVTFHSAKRGRTKAVSAFNLIDGRSRAMKKFVSSMIFGLVLATGLAVALPASAQEVNRTITITRDSKVGGQAVTKGEYSIKFAEGKDGDLVLLKGKKEVLKASYKVTKLSQPASDTSVRYVAGADGSFQVKRIEFKGKSEAISFE
jgi:hypothetical protein